MHAENSLRILFDAYWWQSGPPSGRNVLTSLVDAWVQEFPGDQVTVALPPGLDRGSTVPLVPDSVAVRNFHVPLQALAASVELAAARGYDVVLAQNFTPVRSDALRATFVHDAMFQEHPEWFTRTERQYLAAIPALARGADLVFTSSESEKERIVRFNAGLAGATKAVGLGLATGFASAQATRPSDAPEPGRFLLAVGRLNVRKNLEFLVDALDRAGVISPELPAARRRGGGWGCRAVGRVRPRRAGRQCGRLRLPSRRRTQMAVLELRRLRLPVTGRRVRAAADRGGVGGGADRAEQHPVFKEFGLIGNFFDPRDAESVVEAVTRALEEGRAGAAASAGLVERYTWKATVRAMRDAIVDQIERRKEPVFRRIIDSAYKRTRGLDQGLDEDLGAEDLARSVGRRVVERVRAGLRGYPSSYFGRSVTLRNRRKLRLGSDTILGHGVTIDALSRKGVVLRDHVTVDQGAILRGSGVIRNLGVGIVVGPRTSIGAFNVLLGQGGIRIGSDCLLGPSVTVVSENHVYVDDNRPIREQGEVRAETFIGDDVWIGAGAVVLGGARIGTGAVIAAGAVVRGEVGPMEIFGGVPARLIGRRTAKGDDSSPDLG